MDSSDTTEDESSESLKEEYETLVKKARDSGLQLDASRLSNAYSGIKYHALNPDEDTKKESIRQFKKQARELREKLG